MSCSFKIIAEEIDALIDTRKVHGAYTKDANHIAPMGHDVPGIGTALNGLSLSLYSDCNQEPPQMSSSTPSVPGTAAARAISRERAAWFALAILLLFSIAAPLNQFKIPPIMPILMGAFKLSVGRAGLLMSVYAVTGLALALPAGFIFQKLGYRITGLIAGGSIALGAVLGATSSGMGSLLMSRVIEGIGTSFMAVLAPAIIAMRFDAQKRGAAMGIWSAWVPIGSTSMLILAPILSLGANWRVVWWFGCVYALVATALVVVFVRPASDSPVDGSQPSPLPVASAAELLRNRDVWLIGLAFAFHVTATMAFGTFLPTYLNVVHGVPLSQAAFPSSVMSMIIIFSCPAGGILSDRIGSRKRLFVLGMALVAVIMPLTAVIGRDILIALVVAQGLVVGLVPTNIFSAAVEAAGDERLGGLAMGIIMVGQNAGMLVGPIVFGALVESAGGWPLAFGSLAVMCLLGALAGWLSRAR
jgi:MFS family permease